MPQNRALVSHVRIQPSQAGQRVDNFLMARLKGVPRSHVYRLLRTGQVRINGRRSRAHHRLQAGDQLRIPPWHGATREQIERVPAVFLARLAQAIVYDDNDLMVLNKPGGLAVHGGSGIRHGIVEGMRALRPRDTGLALAHRLDRDSSGCLAIAKTRPALLHLHELFRTGSAGKIYWALLHGCWQGGERVVDARLVKGRSRSGERMAEISRERGRTALSTFRPLARSERASLIEVTIATGRMHQIRAHAAHIGYPIAGDSKYGTREGDRSLRTAGLKRLFLHACRLQLPRADGEGALTVTAPLPADLEQVLARLGLGAPQT